MNFELLGNGEIKVQFAEFRSGNGNVIPQESDWLKSLLPPKNQTIEAEKIIECREPGNYCRGEGELKQISIDGNEGIFFCPYLVNHSDGNCQT